MKPTLLRVAALALACAVSPHALALDKGPPKGPDGGEKLDGVWVATGGESGGTRFGAADLGGLKLTFKGKVVRWEQQGGEAVESTYAAGAGKGHKQIDFGGKAPVGKKPPAGLSGVGIYKIEGGKLYLHVAMPGGTRPKDFTSQRGVVSTVYVLERVKKASKDEG